MLDDEYVIPSMVERWDAEAEESLGPLATLDERRPYGRILDPLSAVAVLRFSPYHLDDAPGYIAKLTRWLRGIPSRYQRAAFLLANCVTFVTEAQFHHLQRRFLRYVLLPCLLRRAAHQNGWASARSPDAMRAVPSILSEVLFSENSDSSRLNDFMHQNDDLMKRTGPSRNDGPPMAYLVRNAELAARCGSNAPEREEYLRAQHQVNRDPVFRGKRTLVVLEDFSGSGDSLIRTINYLERAELPVGLVVLAPMIATEHAIREIQSHIQARGSAARLLLLSAMVIPDSQRCYGDPRATLGAEHEAVYPRLRTDLQELSEWFASIDGCEFSQRDKDGYGALALAFAHSWNCPNNTLPIIWSRGAGSHNPLFRRSGRSS